MQHSPHLWPGRLKSTPDDFYVEEEISLPPGGHGAFRLYRLSKRSWGTEELVRHLARRLGVPRAAIAYGGRKDRAAVTVQHLSIRGRRDRSTEGEGFQLLSLGFVDRPMGPDVIAANHFRIVVRALDPLCTPEVDHNLRRLAGWGVPNYFDDQRFRSVPQYRGFPAAFLVRKQWEAALRLLLTSAAPGASRRQRDRLARLDELWGHWHQCLALAQLPHERRVFEELARPGGTTVRALAAWPREWLSMLLACYQSYLWNQALAAAVQARGAPTVALPGLAGDYLFPVQGGEDLVALSQLAIPTPGPRLAAGDPVGTQLMHHTLTQEGITPADLSLRPLRTAFLKSTLRRAWVRPTRLTWEWHPLAAAGGRGGATLHLAFSLPPGCYATMVLRGALLRQRPQRTTTKPFP